MKKILFLNGFSAIEGDVRTMLDFIESSQHKFECHILSIPYGMCYNRLSKYDNIILNTLLLGGNESSGQNSDRLKRFFYFARAICIVSLYIYHNDINYIYTIDRGVSPQILALSSLLTKKRFILNAAYPYYPNNGIAARYVLKSAYKIHAHSYFLKDKLAKFTDANKISVVPNGVNPSMYINKYDKNQLYKKYDVPNSFKIIGMSGRIDKYKGQDILIDAASLILHKIKNINILISGRGSDILTNQLKEKIKSYSIDNYVKLIGYVDSIPEFFNACYLITMPSWEEPFGLVALEGMACSKPIISTRAGGVPEFVSDKNGLLVEPKNATELANAIIYLLSNDELAISMGQAGRKMIEEHYNLNRYIESISLLFSE